VAFGYFKLAVVLDGLVVPTLVARAHQVLGADD